MGMDVSLSCSAAGAALLLGTAKYAKGKREQEMAEVVLLPGDTGLSREVLSPHSGFCSTKCLHHCFRMESPCWSGCNTSSQNPVIAMLLFSSSSLINNKMNFLSLKVIPVSSDNLFVLLCSSKPSFPQTKLSHLILQAIFHLSFHLSPHFSTLLRQCKTFSFCLRGRFEEFSCSLGEVEYRLYLDVVTCFWVINKILII